MSLSNDQIKILIDKFIISDHAKSWRDQRENDHKKWKKWIDPEVVASIDDDDLKYRFLEYFNEGAGRHGFNAIYRDRIIRNVKQFKRTLIFLLDEKIELKTRLDQILERSGKYRIEGLGKGLTTSILVDLNPMKYATWNNKTDMGLEALGMVPQFQRGDTMGDKYLKVLKSIKSIKDLKPDLNYIEIDHLLHIVSAEEEGISAVSDIILGNNEIIETLESITAEGNKMEFAMEEYLEEFIQNNFEKIDFGTKLELFQDEENNGRQYVTPIGKIDLLALDKIKRQFVVIELKKGKTSDSVIGQILRYMGWIHENMLKDEYENYSVGGIIIANEKDEKLRFALKLTSNIELFLYKVDFKLNKT